MSKNALKRIVNDIASLKKDPLENIYIDYNEHNIFKVTALIIGIKDTPYEGGFFFFTIIFSNKYPFNPPKVTFDTIDGNVRFNPNLYQDGKVCLSIINTWPGPKWTSVQTLRSLLLSLQSLLNTNPLLNEPGYEELLPSDDKVVLYNNIIKYETLRLGVFNMLENSTHPEFNNIIKNYFISNYEIYLKLVNEFCNLNIKDQKLQSPIYFNCFSDINSKQLKINLNKIKNNL